MAVKSRAEALAMLARLAPLGLRTAVRTGLSPRLDDECQELLRAGAEEIALLGPSVSLVGYAAAGDAVDRQRRALPDVDVVLHLA